MCAFALFQNSALLLAIFYEGSQEKKFSDTEKSRQFDQRSTSNINPIQVTKSVNCASYLWILILRGPRINQVMK